MSQKNPVLIIAGPTGSGKSALALDLAREFTGTVINADSMQVYRELRVLTARPGADEEAQAPHRLFGVRPASEACSAGRWLKMAVAEIEKAHATARLPIVVGGTGLYLKVLTEGLAPIPDIPGGVNEETQDLYDRLGEDAFRVELMALDPDATERISPGDGQRLTRAMAVVRATGRTLGDWRRDQGPGPALDARFAVIQLMPGRDALYAATDARFDAMLAAGALEEVRALTALGLDPSLPAMKALGVRELGRHLAGGISLQEASGAAKQATRNFAKRQLTWLR
ncbi:MAG: tRNA (adenosine(37)-N6)-dimethylallyltransferase MiaA, partial [Proteobacteria bacterium]|nr:tRNA (adenosine(37)-N6)-dimethylallyltransferase MiaA [Pseudomonadota bacterium]